jgi:aminoglycoside phosphotransferase
VESPPADVLAWAESVVGDRVAGVQAMVGGLDAHMFRVATDGGTDVVLRITRDSEWEDVEHLALILEMLAPSDVPAPKLLGRGREVGAGAHPVLLQSLLPGDPSLPREPSEGWLRSLAETVVAIQAVRAPDWLPDRVDADWAELGDVDDDDDKLTDLDRRLLASLRRYEVAHHGRVLGHNDLWVGNTLRDGDHVVGVVDWGDAGLISAARDVTYCAVDMSVCYGVAYGDRLVDAFRRQVDVGDEEVDLWTARAVVQSRWFVEWLKGWNGLGVPVQRDPAARRRAELLDRVLTRLG